MIICAISIEFFCLFYFDKAAFCQVKKNDTKVSDIEKVYVVDYRYWNGNLIQMAKEKKVDDVIFVNNLSMIRSDYLTGKLGQIIE